MDPNRLQALDRAQWAAAYPYSQNLEGLTVALPKTELTEIYLPLCGLLANLRPAVGPLIVGITGSVSAGKTTFAQTLHGLLADAGLRVETVSTDGFLFPNRVLTERGILRRKGFPESYDTPRLTAFLGDVRASSPTVIVPLYEHSTYDITGQRTLVSPLDLLILEGLNLPAVRSRLDLLVYVDADEADLLRWYTERFLRLQAAARNDSGSYYHRFRDLNEPDSRDLAASVWNEINLPNLREHIAPARGLADLVLHKSADHTVERIHLRAALTPSGQGHRPPK